MVADFPGLDKAASEHIEHVCLCCSLGSFAHGDSAIGVFFATIAYAPCAFHLNRALTMAKVL
jgi:hypothetical protein